MFSSFRLSLLLIAALLHAGAAHADETVTYTYDAKGRLVKVVHTGTVNNNVQTTYAHDKADNRTNVTTTGSQNGGSGSGGATTNTKGFVVTPLGGYTLVFYQN